MKGDAAYRRASLPVERRVEDLLGRMTLKEKIAQLGAVMTQDVLVGKKFSPTKAKKQLRNGTGQITRAAGLKGGIGRRPAAKILRDIQAFLTRHTRLGIPAVIHEECLSGFMARGGTTFPQAIGMASTWDPNLVRRITSVIREQIRAIGARQVFAPLLDVARDPRWGRTEETFGEDPYLVARMAVAYIQGLHGPDLKRGIIATPKHFAAHGMADGGRNCAPVRVGPREFRETHLFPFEATVKVARVRSVMNAYHSLDGIPCAGDRKLLTGILRDEWGFTGYVSADYGSVKMLQTFHHVAASEKEAAVMALEAGMDVELPQLACFATLPKAIEQGLISESVVDEAVRRVLRVKFEVGLFERPVPDAKAARRVFDTPADRRLARRAAVESIVLLQNDGLLPLKKDLKAIAVVGPNADSVDHLYGDYGYASFFPGENHLATVTVLQGIRNKLGKKATIRHAGGCDMTGTDRSGFARAVRAAEKSDVVVAVLGEMSGFPMGNISGERHDRPTLALPEVQEELLDALCGTGKPVVLVLVNGRPLSVGRFAGRCAAIVEAWFPGEEGGNAVADVLFGDAYPSGKLPISVPRSAGDIPVHYSRRASGIGPYTRTDTAPPSEIESKALFPFGHGLSYTTFRYSRLRITPKKCGGAGKVTVRFDLANTGRRKGDEIVQLYVRDEVASVSRPVMELKGFQRVTLAPGERKTITFVLHPDQLAFYDRDMRLVVEPGRFRVMVGASSADIRLKGAFNVTGPLRAIAQRRVFFSEACVE